ncbi:membrane-associated protein, putative [Bodo saltans]|uniref:Membrane-associated protein, putative n=1 Tax=Bodo saltans TaxID=75058 RepID=A0A0S4IP26_BODSA|nr:membrane-associated protein, putative [Bodo saltans]|eukprot:CUE69532.1 membrane-associated protein, putative [Bodo saltans]
MSSNLRSYRVDWAATTLVLFALVATCADGVAFSGVFEASTFSASQASQNQLGSSLQTYFRWGDAPIFSLFQGSAGPSPTTVTVLFGFGSSDPTANQLQETYSDDVANYLSGNSNATLLRASLQGNGILLYSIDVVNDTPQPTSAGGADDESPLKEYLPAIIVGGVVLVIIVVGVLVFVVMKRRSALDDRIFDTMEAMMDEDSERATQGVEGVQPTTKASAGAKLPPPTSSAARSPAPPPQQSV